MALAFVSFLVQGPELRNDFRGGTTIRTESAQPVDVGAYPDAIAPLGLGDVSITEVFDPTFGPDENVAMIRHPGPGGRGKRLARGHQRGQEALRGGRARTSPSVGRIGRPERFRRTHPDRDHAVVLAMPRCSSTSGSGSSGSSPSAPSRPSSMTCSDHRHLLRASRSVRPRHHRRASDHRRSTALNDTVVVFDRVRENLREVQAEAPARDSQHSRSTRPSSRTVLPRSPPFSP